MQGLGFMVQGLGCRVQVFRVLGNSEEQSPSEIETAYLFGNRSSSACFCGT